MQRHRLTGHNVLHLIYPIKTNEKSLSDCLKDGNWEELYKKVEEENENRIHNENFHYVFPTTHEKENTKSGKQWLPDNQIISYFHPSVQEALFHYQLGKLQAYRYKMSPKSYIGELSDGNQNFYLEFEWLSTEIYSFGSNSGVLVLRVCLLENVEVIKSGDNFETIRHNKSVQPLNVYMMFMNRIRQNYQKYEGQKSLNIIAHKKDNKAYQNYDSKTSVRFFNIFEDSKILPKTIKISSVKINNQQQEIDPRLKTIEPNTFVHSLIQCDLNGTELLTNELYQIIHIDDYEGESGGNASFKEDFVKNHTYTRWENMNTYYTGIEYGAVTFIDAVTNYENEDFYFPNVLYQHHCRIYLIMIVLQYYYREELQEIIGRYARLDLKNDYKLDEEQARGILKDYYDLNQFVFFKRISQEIQGTEMWNFYLQTFGINSLYEDASNDVSELNQRLIEQHANEQEEVIQKLTIIAAFTGLFGMNLIIPFFDSISLTSEQKQDIVNFLQKIGIHLNTTIISNIMGTIGVLLNVAVIIIICYIFWKFIFSPKVWYKKRRKK